MDIKKPGTATAPRPDVRVDVREQAPAATAETENVAAPIQDHIKFFEEKDKYGQGTGRVTAASTKVGLEKLGLGHLSRAFGQFALTVPFAAAQGNDKSEGEVMINRIHEGVRADGTDSGVYNPDGSLNSDKLVELVQTHAGDKGYFSEQDIEDIIDNKPVNALEFVLLRDLASVIAAEGPNKGERIIPVARMMEFYDGSLFENLAAARESGTLYKPTGVLKHDGVRAASKTLASMAMQYGGPLAGTGASAMYGMRMAIDQAASLEYQSDDKSLGATIGNAAREGGEVVFDTVTEKVGNALYSVGAFLGICPAMGRPTQNNDQ